MKNIKEVIDQFEKQKEFAMNMFSEGGMNISQYKKLIEQIKVDYEKEICEVLAFNKVN